MTISQSRQAMHTMPSARQFGYAVGQISSNTKDTLFHYFFLLFFSQALGLPATLVGAVALFALLIDAVSDPVIGGISDSWRSEKWGRRHGFMIAAALPLGLSIGLLFSPPINMGPVWIILWMAFFAVSVRLSLTIFNVPYLALNAELVDGYDERTRLAMLRNIIGNLASIAMFATFFIVFLKDTPEFPDGQLNSEAYRHIGLVGGCVAAFAAVASTISTKRYIPALKRAEPGQTKEKWWRFHTQLIKAFALRSFRSLTFGYIVISALSGVATALAIYLFSYYWALTKVEIFTLILILGLSVLPGSFLAYWFSKRFEKRMVLLVALFSFGVFYCAPILLRIFGYMPSNDSDVLFPVLCAFLFTSQAFAIAINVISQSMMADVSDEYRHVSGQAKAGSLFAAITFSQKVNFGLGTFLAGFGLDLIDFPVKTSVNDIPAETIASLGILILVAVAGMTVLTGILWMGYDLTRKRLAKIQHLGNL